MQYLRQACEEGVDAVLVWWRHQLHGFIGKAGAMESIA